MIDHNTFSDDLAELYRFGIDSANPGGTIETFSLQEARMSTGTDGGVVICRFARSHKIGRNEVIWRTSETSIRRSVLFLNS